MTNQATLSVTVISMGESFLFRVLEMIYISSDVDVGGNYEFIISHFGGKKPGVTVTCMGVAALQITYKDRGHKLRLVCNYSTHNKL